MSSCHDNRYNFLYQNILLALPSVFVSMCIMPESICMFLFLMFIS